MVEKERGFTLLEVLLAIFLLTVLTMCLGSGLFWGIRRSRDNKAHTDAIFFAQALMESLLTGLSVEHEEIKGDLKYTTAIRPFTDSLSLVEVVVAHTETGDEVIALRTLQPAGSGTIQ